VHQAALGIAIVVLEASERVWQKFSDKCFSFKTGFPSGQLVKNKIKMKH
jgi:hypothetical protein